MMISTSQNNTDYSVQIKRTLCDMMRCPICKGTLDEQDELLLCQGKCGSEFGLEYLGMYEPGDDERTDDGFEPQEWKQEYEDIKNDFKFNI